MVGSTLFAVGVLEKASVGNESIQVTDSSLPRVEDTNGFESELEETVGNFQLLVGTG